MPLLLGTDEAGYGPNLGPLVITGTLWSSPPNSSDLFPLLGDVIAQTPTPGRLQVADSKKVYSSSGGIERLELGVLSILFALHNQLPANSEDLGQLLGFSAPQTFWLDSTPLPLPLKANPDDILKFGQQIAEAWKTNDCPLIQIKSRCLFADEFNRLVHQMGNKATLLSSATLEIAHDLLQLSEKHPAEKVIAVCDKHGGRSKYAGLLQEFITEHLVHIEVEGLRRSTYSWREQQTDIEFNFVAGGESFLPTAVASMVSKYVREIFMTRWNQFWKLEVPNVKPTKGYPLDAKRFKRDIRTRLDQLGVEESSFWRHR